MIIVIFYNYIVSTFEYNDVPIVNISKNCDCYILTKVWDSSGICESLLTSVVATPLPNIELNRSPSPVQSRSNLTDVTLALQYATE